MRIFNGFEDLPDFVRPAVTVGSFDGVHCGHQALLKRLLEEARNNGGESIVLTFEPHPRVTLGQADGLHLLTDFSEKCALLEEAEVDNLVVIPFDRSFSALSGRDFIEGYLIGRLGAEVLVAGFNHRFGHDRIASDDPRLAEWIRVVRVGPCLVDGVRVSSTAIRRLLDAGDCAAAEHLAGHPLPQHAAATEEKTEHQQ